MSVLESSQNSVVVLGAEAMVPLAWALAEQGNDKFEGGGSVKLGVSRHAGSFLANWVCCRASGASRHLWKA